MATKVRVGTFNCENLFARFRFRSNVKVANATKDGFTINDLAFDFLKPDEKTLTGQAIRALDADVIALQEVENFDVLKRFRNEYLKPMKCTHGVLIEGNDPRFIDVAVLSRYPLTRIVTHQELRSGNSSLFSRDCLEVDVKGKPPIALREPPEIHARQEGPEERPEEHPRTPIAPGEDGQATSPGSVRDQTWGQVVRHLRGSQRLPLCGTRYDRRHQPACQLGGSRERAGSTAGGGALDPLLGNAEGSRLTSGVL